MKKIIFILLILVPFICKADTIYNIDMYIKILEDGSATVTETWDVKADSGTEWYKEYKNLDNIEISNFSVSMDNQNLLMKPWNINESLSEKRGYYGIYTHNDSVELCFGKADHKRHNFILRYDLSNFVFNTSDSQVVYFTFLPRVNINNFSVVIDSFYDFPDNLDVWGYGYKGYAYVENGKIKMSNDGKLKNEYVTLLAKFPLSTYKTSNYYNMYDNFSDVYKRAEEGTFEYDYSSKIELFEGIFIMLTVCIPLLTIISSIYLIHQNNYGYINNKTIDKKNIPMFREIPCNKDIYYANTLLKLNKTYYKNTNILGAIILKWVKEDKIEFNNKTSRIFNKETSSIKMDINNSNYIINKYEKELYNVMYEASIDGILETKELEKWCRDNYSKFFKILNDLVDDNIKILKGKHHIYNRNNKNECKYKNVMDDSIYEDSKQLYGLKLFLEEFSSIDTKQVIEVKLWDEYLMFAYLFGIADKVSKQLKNLYPEVLESLNVDYDTVIFVNNITTRSVSAATNARAAAKSYSSGGGGFSSGGGGGGSFGGGGSMGGR